MTKPNAAPQCAAIIGKRTKSPCALRGHYLRRDNRWYCRYHGTATPLVGRASSVIHFAPFPGPYASATICGRWVIGFMRATAQKPLVECKKCLQVLAR